jgi:hypothetical protein
MMSQADGAAEEQKRILGVLMEGRLLVVIDNIDRVLKSDTLCTVLTEERYSGRLLGTNQVVDLPCKATFFATGNNLTLSDDLTRRAVVCFLDPERERPDQRDFDGDPEKAVLQRRAELVVALLTMVRAYRAAGSPRPKVFNFGGYEDWCWSVRYPLIWLGMADPCEGRERLEDRDPVREQLIALLTAWYEVFGSEGVKVADAIREATDDPDGPTTKAEARKVLCEVLAEVGGRSGKISPTAIGKFIASHEHRVEGSLRFEKAGKAKGAVLWRVKAIGEHNQLTAKGEVGEVGEVESTPIGKGISEGGGENHQEEALVAGTDPNAPGAQKSVSAKHPHHPHPYATSVDGTDTAVRPPEDVPGHMPDCAPPDQNEQAVPDSELADLKDQL